MATKKNNSSEPQLETKTAKASDKATTATLSSTQSSLEKSKSCCTPASNISTSHAPFEIKNANGQEKPTQHGLPLTSSSSHKSEGCCTGTSVCGTGTTQLAQKHATSTSTQLVSKGDVKKGPKTRVTVRYDVGFNNSISIRGKGANLSWDHGFSLKNTNADEWIWETETPFSTCEFKVLINDNQYEIGDNHSLSCGANIKYTPTF